MIYIILWILFGVYNLYWVLYKCDFKLIEQETLKLIDLYIIFISIISGPIGTVSTIIHTLSNIDNIKNPFYRGK